LLTAYLIDDEASVAREEVLPCLLTSMELGWVSPREHLPLIYTPPPEPNTQAGLLSVGSDKPTDFLGNGGKWGLPTEKEVMVLTDDDIPDMKDAQRANCRYALFWLKHQVANRRGTLLPYIVTPHYRDSPGENNLQDHWDGNEYLVEMGTEHTPSAFMLDDATLVGIYPRPVTDAASSRVIGLLTGRQYVDEVTWTWNEKALTPIDPVPGVRTTKTMPGVTLRSNLSAGVATSPSTSAISG